MLCVLILNMAMAQKVTALNNALDMAVVDKGEKILLTLQLNDMPKYSISQPDKKQLILVLFDTTKTAQIENKAAQQNIISINDHSGSSDLTLQINLNRQVIEINSSWLGPEKSLSLEIIQAEEGLSTQPTPLGAASLRDIRFGFQEKATRMVMRLDQQPSWMMTYHDPTTIGIRLKAHSDKLKGKRYGPMNRIKEVLVLKRDNQDMNIGLQSETNLSRVRIFWMSLGNRLVMDLFDESTELNEANLPSVIVSESHQPKGELQGVTTGNEMGQNPTPFGQTTTAWTGSIVRMKIPKLDSSGSDKPPAVGPLPNAAGHRLMVAPKLNNNLPSIPVDEEVVKNLKPAEAFLFGRIQEAREMNDFQKGLSLIDQFIMQFPESPLIENVLFWRGDLYYFLWEKGDTKVAQNVIQSYKFAINRFGRSKYAPMVYIKMAQVSSQIGDHFSAIGYLSVVTGNKKNEEYFPLAYLTRGKIYLQMDQPERAVQSFETLLTQYPHSPLIEEANFWIANYYYAIGQYEEAEKRLTDIKNSNSSLYLEYPEHLLLNAKNYLYLKKYDLARDYLFKALNLGHQPETPDLLLSRIGDTYYHQDRKNEAGKYYRMVMDYYPGTEGASIAKIRMADYFSDIAILEDLSEGGGDEPLSELALLEKAYQLYERKQYGEVMESLKDLILKTIPTETRRDAKQLYMRAAEKEMEQLHHDHRYGELIDLYEAHQGTWPDIINPEVMLFIALAFKDLQKYGQAVSTFETIKLYDLNQVSKGRYIMGLAESYLAENDLKAAQKVLLKYKDEALKAIDEQRAIMFLADTYMEEGRNEEAQSLYRSLIKREPRLPNNELAKVFFSLGHISMITKNYDQAEKAFKQSIKWAETETNRQSLFHAAYIGLGNVYHNQGRFRQAAVLYEKGFSLGYGPDQKDYWEDRFRLAVTYMKVGDNKKAETILNEISEEGDPILQQMAQIRLGSIGLEKHLKRLSINVEH